MSGQAERAVVNAVSDSEIIALEMELIRIRSYPLEETRLAEYIVGFLKKEGIAARLQEVPVPTAEGIRLSHNAIGVLEGSGAGRSLLLNGHIDVNPTDLAVGGTAFTQYSGWRRNPFEPVLEEDRIYGKGAYDEKGGICAMLSAAVAIKRAGIALGGTLYFCPVMGHYTESIGTKQLLREGIRADYGICTENSGSWIVPAHNGGVIADVRVRGVNPGTKYSLPETLHRATGFANAIRFIHALGPEGTPHPEDSWTTFTPHLVLNVFPNHRIGSIMPVDKALDHIATNVLIKTVPGMTAQTCRDDLMRVVRQLEQQYPDFVAGEVTSREWAPPLVTPPESPVVTALGRAYRTVTGRDPRVGVEPRLGAMGDSGCMGAAGIETCIFGPGVMHDVAQLRGEMPPDESISVQELTDAARVMALAAIDLCQ